MRQLLPFGISKPSLWPRMPRDPSSFPSHPLFCFPPLSAHLPSSLFAFPVTSPRPLPALSPSRHPPLSSPHKEPPPFACDFLLFPMQPPTPVLPPLSA